MSPPNRLPEGQVPEPVAYIAGLFSTYPAPWALCGGWAVDAWLGRVTRDHLDVDITVFAADNAALRDHLRGWTLIPHDAVSPESKDPWDGRELVPPGHIHAAETPEVASAWVDPDAPRANGLKLDIELNELADAGWVLHTEPHVAFPLERAFNLSPWGMPTVVPEVLAFYKATAYFDDPRFSGRRPHDEVDFRALWELLDGGARAWLRSAVAAARPRHPWLASP